MKGRTFMKKIILLFSIFMLSACGVNAATYYVDDLHGDDSFAGTASQPFKTIQKAADCVAAGDTVIIRDGIYYGPVNINKKGTREKPIAFIAENKGFEKVILTNANRKLRENVNKDIWNVYDKEKGIYAADYRVLCNAVIDNGEDSAYLAPTRILCNDIDLMGYVSYSDLENNVVSDGMYGYESGYYYDSTNRKLYIRLNDRYTNPNPNENIIKVSPSTYPYISDSNKNLYGWSGTGYQYDVLGRDSFNICVGNYNEEAATGGIAADSYYVTIDGITFETPGFCGVYLRASDCVVRNCWFRGCRAGVRGAARVRLTDEIYAKNIIIENCDFTQYPTFSDAENYIFENYENSDITSNIFFWWQRKFGAGIDKKFNYENGGFVSHMGEYWTLRYNYIHECFDGISYGAMRKYSISKDGSEYEVPAEHIEIYQNKFEKCLDNCIELENRAKNINIYQNEFFNSFVPISYQPLNGTPWPTNINIYNNIIRNTADFNYFWVSKAKFTPYVFKFGASKDQWKTVPWMQDIEWDTENDIPKDSIYASDRGVRIYNNDIIMPYGYLFGNVSGKGGSQIKFSNFYMYNNFILSRVKVISGSGLYQTGAIMYNNSGFDFSNNVFAPDIPGNYEITDDVLDNGMLLYGAKSAGFARLTRINFDPTLTSDSPLIGAGKQGKDVGAVGIKDENAFGTNIGPQ